MLIEDCDGELYIFKGPSTLVWPRGRHLFTLVVLVCQAGRIVPWRIVPWRIVPWLKTCQEQGQKVGECEALELGCCLYPAIV